MSWSKSHKGMSHEVKKAVASWADEQKTLDTKYASTQAAVDGHQAQVKSAATAITAIADAAPDGTILDVSAWGHHNGDPASHQGGLRVDYTVPSAQ